MSPGIRRKPAGVPAHVPAELRNVAAERGDIAGKRVKVLGNAET